MKKIFFSVIATAILLFICSAFTVKAAELKITLSTETPTTNGNPLIISKTTVTPDIGLLRFIVTAHGSSIAIDQIPVLFQTSETELYSVTANFTLKIGGNIYHTGMALPSGGSKVIINFGNLGITIPENSSMEGYVYADIKPIGGPAFDEGSTLNAAITSALVTATSGNYIDAEDMNGDQLVASDRTGSATGEMMTFRSLGINIVMDKPNYVTQYSPLTGVPTMVTYYIPVAITSTGSTSYIGQKAQMGTVATGSKISANAFSFTFHYSAEPGVDDTTNTVSATFTSFDAIVEGNGFRLDDGMTKHFVITVVLVGTERHGMYSVQLKQARIFTEALLQNGTNIVLLPSEQYETDWIPFFGAIIHSATEIEEVAGNRLVKVSSCPAGIRIYSEKDAVVEFYTIDGRKVLTASHAAEQTKIFSWFDGLLPGIYNVRVLIEESTVVTQTAVIK